MLLKAHPDAVKKKDGAGWLPLYRALVARASDAVIEMLLKAHPDAAKEKDWAGWLPLRFALVAPSSDAVIAMLFKEQSGLANFSASDIASLVCSVYSLDKNPPRLFPVVSLGLTTLGAFDSVISALMATCQGDTLVLKKNLRTFRMWHRGGMLWKMCIERTVGQVLPRLAADIISKFACGECACELCCRPRPEAEAAPGSDE
eukprot:NODE_22204_length_718_cov_2.698816.p1 GENE.NODE_22204_length_718_cov_2.698816~~NODE_22204_length_718_cov_2.698816.p1  ORF type:complete len:202 (+),score=13.31 NODE_22204_length_718_cov_2.698816:98-703(+)